MAIYKVILTLEIDESSIEAASSSEAESLAIEDAKTRFHKDVKVTVVSVASELE